MNKFVRAIGIAVLLSSSGAAMAAGFSTGDIFAAVGNGKVNQYTNGGAFIQTLDSLQGGFTTGMAFDSTGNLYVTNFSAGNITRFSNVDGSIIAPNPFASPGAANESISFASNGDFYVGRASGTPQKYTSAGALITTFSTPVNSDWLDLAANQTTLFYNDESGLIRRWDTVGNIGLADFANNAANGGTASYALRILGNGNVLTAANNIVIQYDSAGNKLGQYDATGVDGFFALNIDPDGQSFWTGSFQNNTLYRWTIGNYGLDNFNQSLVTGGQLFGVALAGEITVGNPGGVPEPASWAMLLAGFGLVGAVMRRRSHAVAA